MKVKGNFREDSGGGQRSDNKYVNAGERPEGVCLKDKIKGKEKEGREEESRGD